MSTSQLSAEKNQKRPEVDEAAGTTVPTPEELGEIQVARTAKRPSKHRVVALAVQPSATGKSRYPTLPVGLPLWPPTTSFGLPSRLQTATRPGVAVSIGTLMVDRIWSVVRATFQIRTS